MRFEPRQLDIGGSVFAVIGNRTLQEPGRDDLGTAQSGGALDDKSNRNY
jgi:hypothetical protein